MSSLAFHDSSSSSAFSAYQYHAPTGGRSASACSYDRAPLSRSGSRSNVYSRCGSTAPTANVADYYSSGRAYESSHSRSSTPGMSYSADSQQWSRSSSRSGSRSGSPTPSYSEALIKASRRLRERSIPPPPPPPEPPIIYHPTSTRRRFGSGSSAAYGKPPLPPMVAAPAGAKVVASDFYRGKVKSIYEREPLFKDFAEGLRLEEKKTSLYNAENLDKIKRDFYRMVEDKWTRKNFCDPSVEHDLGRKLLPWQNVVGREAEPASTRIARIQASRPRLTTPPPLPRIRLYHKSTMH